jgi:hypothetical protein
MIKRKRTNNYQQNNTQKTKDRATRTLLKTGVSIDQAQSISSDESGNFLFLDEVNIT